MVLIKSQQNLLGLSSSKIDEYEYVTGKEIFFPKTSNKKISI